MLLTKNHSLEPHMDYIYITSPGLPITRGSPGQTVQSGRAGPGPGCYKNTTTPPGIRFLAAAAILGASGGATPRRATDVRRSRGERASGDSAPEADGQRRRTLGPVATAVVRGALGVGGGHEVRGSLRRSRETRSSLMMAATQGMGGSGVLRRPTHPIWRLRRRPLI
jgi:hypothetical protein